MKKVITIALLFLTIPPTVYASVAPTSCDQLPPPLTCIGSYMQGAVTALMTFAGVTALLFIIMGGLQWITSNGEPKAVEKARNTLTYSIVGLFVVLLAGTIMKLLETFLGITILTFSLSF